MMKNILVATDGSDHAVKAISLAADLAVRYHARLTILHSLLQTTGSATLRKLADRKALGPKLSKLLDTYEIDATTAMASMGDGIPYPILPPRELVGAIGRQVVDRAVRQAKKAGVKKVEGKVMGGDPADLVLAQAKRLKVDTIVLGSRGLGNIKGFFLGSVSHKVSSHATCTCITVK
jgi:nucleotide-binding universal stress UspA family protein